MFVQGRVSAIHHNPVAGMHHMNHMGNVLQMGQGRTAVKQDVVSISAYGKMNSAMDGLMKLKQQIEEKRSQFLSKAAEEGKSGDAIQDQLKKFDEQLKSIDMQIAQMAAQRQNQNVQKEKKEKSSLYERPKTRQEVENERLADITNLSSGLSKAKVIKSVKTRVDGEAGVLEAEIELAKIRGTEQKYIDKMEAKLADLQKESSQLTSDIHGQLNETVEDIQESNDKYIHAEIEDTEQREDQKDNGEENLVNKNDIMLQTEINPHNLSTESAKDETQTSNSNQDEKV